MRGKGSDTRECCGGLAYGSLVYVACIVLALIAGAVIMAAYTWARWDWPKTQLRYVSPRLLLAAGVWLIVAAIAAAISC